MKRFFIALIGGTVLLIGVGLLVFPATGLALILAGLAILATEFLWARRAVHHAKGAITKVRRKARLPAWLRRKRPAAAESPKS